MRRLEQWIRKRGVRGAELLVAVEIDVEAPDAAELVTTWPARGPQAAVRQQWHVPADEQPWLEPFLLVAYSTKQVSNFRGDVALGVWAEIAGEAPAIFAGQTYTFADVVDNASGTYCGQVFRRRGAFPFIQTPVTGGSARARASEVAGSARALSDALSRNSSAAADRVKAAKDAMSDLGFDFAERPSVGGARDLTLAVMASLEAQGVVPPLEAAAGPQ